MQKRAHVTLSYVSIYMKFMLLILLFIVHIFNTIYISIELCISEFDFYTYVSSAFILTTLICIF